MGTSANLWVRGAGKEFVQHTSYDATTANIFALMGATVASCGLEALRQAMSSAEVVHEDSALEEEEDGVSPSGFTAGATAYLAACQALGHEPWGLVEAVRYDYGVATFGVGGVIGLMGDRHIHQEGFASSSEDCDFLLDIDKGILACLRQAFEEASPSVPSTTFLWTLDLGRLQGLNPTQVYESLSSADFDDMEEAPEEERLVYMDGLVGALAALPARAAEVQLRRPGHAFSAGGSGDGAPGAHAKGLHLFEFHHSNAASVRLVGGLFQRHAALFPALARPNVLVCRMTPDEHETVVLCVDLNEGFAIHEEGEAVHEMLAGVGEFVGRQLGGRYRSKVGGGSSTIGPHASMFSASSGGFDDEDDDVLFGGGGVKRPEGVTPLRTPGERFEQLQTFLQNMDTDEQSLARVVGETAVALADFDVATLDLVGDKGMGALDAGTRAWAGALATMMTPLEEKVVPGARRAHFESLSEGQRSAVLESMAPLDRYLFVQDLGLKDDNTTEAAPRRPGM